MKKWQRTFIDDYEKTVDDINHDLKNKHNNGYVEEIKDSWCEPKWDQGKIRIACNLCDETELMDYELYDYSYRCSRGVRFCDKCMTKLWNKWQSGEIAGETFQDVMDTVIVTARLSE